MAHVGSWHWVLGSEGPEGDIILWRVKKLSVNRLWSMAEEPGVFILQRTWRGG